MCSYIQIFLKWDITEVPRQGRLIVPQTFCISNCFTIIFIGCLEHSRANKRFASICFACAMVAFSTATSFVSSIVWDDALVSIYCCCGWCSCSNITGCLICHCGTIFVTPSNCILEHNTIFLRDKE